MPVRAEASKASWRGGALAALCVATMITLYLGFSGAAGLRAIETQALDWRFQWRGPIAPGPETVLVMVDDASIAALGGWPFSRRYVADAVRSLASKGARVIALDFLFAARGAPIPPESLARLRAVQDLDLLGEGKAAAEIDRFLDANDPDAALAQAMAAAGNVIVAYAFAFDDATARSRLPPDPVAEAAYGVVHRPPGRTPARGLRPQGLVLPPRALLQSGLPAHVSVLLDEDGSLRREHPAVAYRDRYYPSLPIVAVQRFLGLDRDEVVLRVGEGIKIGRLPVPTDAAMSLPVNHYGPAGSFPTYAFIDVIAGDLPAEAFAGKIVLIGASALGVGDTFVAPFTATLPGVEHYAAVVDNILHQRFLLHQDWTIALDILAIALFGAIAAVLTIVLPPALAALGATVLLLAWVGLNFSLFAEAGLILNLVFPAATILLGYSAFALRRVLGEQGLRHDAERQKHNLSRYVPSAVAASLADSDQPLGSEDLQPAAVLFVDIVGYTRLTEIMDPSQGIALLRDFHRRVEQAVRRHGGVLHQIVGDGAMASFGTRQPGPEAAGQALACARDLAAAIALWSETRSAAGEPPIRIGVGLHYGPVLVGDVGGEQQMQFTLIGDTVNVASRLEALTRQHDAIVVASDSLVAAARAAGETALLEGFERLPAQAIRGREGLVAAWAWRGLPADAASGTAA